MLLSRLAEHIYWAGRYLERAEATARLVHAQTELYLDLPRAVSVGWRPLLAVTGTDAQFDELFDDDEQGVGPTEEHRIVGFLTTADTNPGSVKECIAAARSNLRSARALIPRSGWQAVNSLHLYARQHEGLAVPRRSRLEWLGDVVRQCQTIAGILDGTMSHDHAYSFLQVGRHLERADMTTRVLDVQAGVLLDRRLGDGSLPFADVTWMAVLKSVSAMQMFRRVERAGVSGPRALAFLLENPQFPRSVDYCLTELSRRLIELPRHDDAMKAGAAAQQALVDVDPSGLSGAELHEFMDAMQTRLADIHAAASRTWFAAPTTVDVTSGQTQSQTASVA